MGRRPGSLNKATHVAKADKTKKRRVRFQAREHIPVWRNTNNIQGFMDELGLTEIIQAKRLYKKCIEGVELIYGETLPENLKAKIADFRSTMGKRGRGKSKKTAIGKTAKGKLKYALAAESIEKAGLAFGDQVEEIVSGGQVIVRKRMQADWAAER
jgi:hypothetical protein